MGNFKTDIDVVRYLRDKCYNSCASVTQVKDDMCATLFEDNLCWPITQAGQLVTQNCSGNFLKSTIKGVAQRLCTENGTWSPMTGSNSIKDRCGTFYVNVTQDEEIDLFFNEWIPRIKQISYCGYTLSIISLVLSVCILMAIKRLHCSRNTLHINLFISFILRSLMSILKYSLFVRGTALPHETIYDSNGEPTFSSEFNYSWICKAIVSVRYYFILSNFMLILMESIYLHNLMFLKLFSDHHGVTIYCVLGWGLPFIFIIPWIVLRSLYENVVCWTRKQNTVIALFIDLPIGITVVINFILFLIIVRVLTLKLNNAFIQHRKIKYRKLLKATLILIPLFGVPYSFSLLMSMYTYRNPVLDIIYLFFDQSFAAFQIIERRTTRMIWFHLYFSQQKDWKRTFCCSAILLLNSEVQMEIRRKYILMKDKNNKEFRRSRTISTTQQVSFQLNDEFPTENICMDTKDNKSAILNENEPECYF